MQSLAVICGRIFERHSPFGEKSDSSSQAEALDSSGLWEWGTRRSANSIVRTRSRELGCETVNEGLSFRATLNCPSLDRNTENCQQSSFWATLECHRFFFFGPFAIIKSSKSNSPFPFPPLGICKRPEQLRQHSNVPSRMRTLGQTGSAFQDRKNECAIATWS
jgi:hypothetical protein